MLFQFADYNLHNFTIVASTTPPTTKTATALSPITTPLQRATCWHLVWNCPPQWEKFYVRDMLTPGLEICSETKRASLTALHNRTIVMARKRNEFLQASVDHYELLQAYADQQYTVVTFLLGAESPPQTPACTTPSLQTVIHQSHLVLRNYWTADCASNNKVLFVPMFVAEQAYRTGYNQTCRGTWGRPPQERRDVLLYFSSHHRTSDREALHHAITTEAMHLAQNGLLATPDRVQSYFGGEQRQHEQDYATELASTRYGAVVKGNVEDTWRFTETLFCGAIPFLQGSVWRYYQQWLPSDLMDLLPWYEDGNTTQQDSIENELRKIALQSDENYIKLANEVQTAATNWMDSVRSDLVTSIQLLA